MKLSDAMFEAFNALSYYNVKGVTIQFESARHEHEFMSEFKASLDQTQLMYMDDSLHKQVTAPYDFKAIGIPVFLTVRGE